MRFTKYIVVALAVFVGFSMNVNRAFSADSTGQVGLFLGLTTAKSGSGLTLGLDYERKLTAIHEMVGAGVFLDQAFGKPKGTTLGVPVYVYPYDNVKVYLGPGVKFTTGARTFLVRTGAGYNVKLNDEWNLTPNVNADIASGVSWVYGLTLGMAI